MSNITTQRGLALLGFVVAMATLASIAAYAILFVATSQARLGQFSRERMSSRNLAEAGLVIAMQKLWVDPNYPTCPTPGTTVTTTETVHTSGVITPDPTVEITVTNCGAGNLHTLRARAAYTIF